MDHARRTPLVGYFANRGGPTSLIYQALTVVPCAGCGQAIPAGALFTKHRRGPNDPKGATPGTSQSLQAYCQQCYPFKITGQYPERP